MTARLEDLYDDITMAEIESAGPRPGRGARERGEPGRSAALALVGAVGLGLAQVFEAREPEAQVSVETGDGQDGLPVRVYGIGKGLHPRLAVALVQR